MERLGDYVRRAQQAAAGFIELGDDPRDKHFRAATNAILGRFSPVPRSELQGNPYAGLSLPSLAQALLERAGGRVIGISSPQIVAQALSLTTSDFANILVNVARKSALRGYDAAPETYAAWTTPGTLVDFRPAARVGIGTFAALVQVREGESFTQGSLGDRKETATLATYGKLFAISRAAILNDDLSILDRVPAAMGRAAARLVGDLAYGVLTGNPTMGDSVALFHASHNNLMTGAAISTTSVDAMKLAMRQQAENGDVLGIKLFALLVPQTIEGVARGVASAQYFVGEGGTLDPGRLNTAAGEFAVIADHRLDAASASAWYGVADPANFDGVELGYLDGNPQPRIETTKPFGMDGGMVKVAIDCCAAPLEFRTMVKNPGP